MVEIDFLQEERPITVWRPIPKDHKKPVVGLAAAGIVILLGVCILWGWKWTIASFLVMAIAALGVHYELQKRITVENGYFYLDRGELYLISLAREDERLRAYLQESPENRKSADPSMLPNAFLMSMAEHSVICRISAVNTLLMKNNKDLYNLSVSYELVPYPYNGFMTFSLRNGYENFDSLMQVLKEKARSIKVG